MGLIKAVIPKIKNTLEILLPTILLKTMSLLPVKAALTLTTISGKLVPMATIVKPIMSDDTPDLAVLLVDKTTIKALLEQLGIPVLLLDTRSLPSLLGAH